MTARLGLLALLLLGMLQAALPSSLELSKITQAISGQRKVIRGMNQRYDWMQKQLKDTELLMSSLQRDRFQTQLSLREQGILQRQLHQKIRLLDLNIEKKKQQMARIIVAVYKRGRITSLKWLLDPISDQKQRYRNQVFQWMMHDYHRHEMELSRMKEYLKDNQRLLSLQKTAENRLLIKRKAQQGQLAKIMQDRGRVLDDMDAQMHHASDRLAWLTSQRSLLRQAVKSASDASIQNAPNFPRDFASLRGKMSWPVSGQLIRHFRLSDNIEYRFSAVLIATAQSKDVIAPAAGEVVFSDWLPHYGLMLIIKHDRHYFTLYGHNALLYKKRHELVKAGEVISKTGDTGGMSRKALYFAIRHDEKPLNPSVWCRS
jgi:murein hydrolase activator